MPKVLRKIVEIDEELCDGCGLCVNACHEGAIKIVKGKAKVISQLCDGLGDCIGHCPRGAIRIVEKEVEVEEFSKEPPAFSCPGSAIKELRGASALTQWPVQIRLIPPTAPFLKGADLLVVADCVPFAYPHLHSELMKGKKILVGCPKFDPKEEYLERFRQIIEVAKPKSITVAIMEVPCCTALARIILAAREKAQADVPVEVLVVSVKGEIIHREQL